HLVNAAPADHTDLCSSHSTLPPLFLDCILKQICRHDSISRMACRNLASGRIAAGRRYWNFEVIGDRNLAVLRYLVYALVYRIILELVGHLLADFRIGCVGLPYVVDFDYVEPIFRLYQAANLAWLQRESCLFKLWKHFPVPKISEVAAGRL